MIKFRREEENGMPYIQFKNVTKEYKMGEVTIKALDKTNFDIYNT